ncbi:MAG: apolipoprotein N-acyltransferase [Verrucomicrobia bacterium]|nr:apolipoprotein N-acyltransferase [Deltaproteobacteria bacterium]
MPSSHPMKTALPWIAAITGGILVFLGYAGFDQFYLEWICLIPVLWAIRDQRPGRAFCIGWLAGIVMNIGGFYWAILMFRQFAGMAWPLAALGLLLLAAANGIVFAAWAWATRLITRDSGWNVAWVSPVVWTALEKFWPEIFPNYLGASQYKLSLLTQIADLTGILGVTFIVVYINSTLFAAIEQWSGKRRIATRPLLACAVVLAAVLIYGQVRIRAVDRQAAGAEHLTIWLIQTNRGAGDKRQDPESLLSEHQEMSRTLAASQPLDLIVWPEGVMRLRLMSREGRLPPAALGDTHIATLFGAILQPGENSDALAHNSALLTDTAGRILGSYDKMVLVPFGEFIPFGETFPALYSLVPTSGRFRAGESREPLPFGKHLLSVNICYEDIFPGQVRSLMRGGYERRIPHALFNLTNDSWYGKTTEPIEHLALASFRSIEHRRSLVRSTNTGISAFVDPVGRIVTRSGVWTRETLVDRVPMMQGRTVYALMGDWIGWVCALLSLAGIGRSLIVSARRDKPSQPPQQGPPVNGSNQRQLRSHASKRPKSQKLPDR